MYLFHLRADNNFQRLVKHVKNQQESPNGQMVILSTALSSHEMTWCTLQQITPRITFKPLACFTAHKTVKVLTEMFSEGGNTSLNVFIS